MRSRIKKTESSNPPVPSTDPSPITFSPNTSSSTDSERNYKWPPPPAKPSVPSLPTSTTLNNTNTQQKEILQMKNALMEKMAKKQHDLLKTAKENTNLSVTEKKALLKKVLDLKQIETQFKNNTNNTPISNLSSTSSLITNPVSSTSSSVVEDAKRKAALEAVESFKKRRAAMAEKQKQIQKEALDRELDSIQSLSNLPSFSPTSPPLSKYTKIFQAPKIANISLNKDSAFSIEARKKLLQVELQAAELGLLNRVPGKTSPILTSPTRQSPTKISSSPFLSSPSSPLLPPLRTSILRTNDIPTNLLKEDLIRAHFQVHGGGEVSSVLISGTNVLIKFANRKHAEQAFLKGRTFGGHEITLSFFDSQPPSLNQTHISSSSAPTLVPTSQSQTSSNSETSTTSTNTSDETVEVVEHELDNDSGVVLPTRPDVTGVGDDHDEDEEQDQDRSWRR